MRLDLSARCFVAISCCFAAVIAASAVQAQVAPQVVGPPKSPELVKIEAIVAKVKPKLEKEDWAGALAEIEPAFQVDAQSSLAFLYRGMAHSGAGDFEKALADLKVVTGKPAMSAADREVRADAFTQQSIIDYRQFKFLPAIDNAYYALLEKSEHPPALIARAQAYVGRGLYDKAIWNADTAIRVQPKSHEAYSIRGMAYLAKNNPDQAIKDQTKALELNSGYVLALQRRATAYAQKKDLKQCVKDLEDALKAKPDFADAICDKAYLIALQKNVKGTAEKAAEELDSLIRRQPGFVRAHVDRGSLFLEEKNYDEALGRADEAIKINSNYAPAHNLRGYANLGKKELDAAVADFTKAIELDRRYVLAYNGRSQAYQKLKKTQEARADQNIVASLVPAPAKKQPDKPKEESVPKFVVKSTGVAAGELKNALESAQKIDQFVSANHTKFGVTPLPKTTDEQFLRRVYLDVTGAIPTYQQVKKFQQNTAPNKRSQLIDELLASDGYASHYFNYWADVLRYIDAPNDGLRSEPYKQWIKQSLAENKPWDKMVTEMITAKGLMWEDPASGYLQRDPNMPLDIMNNTVRIFLGTRIGCAQCHNHPFDKWTQREFYEMAAITFGTLHGTHGGDQRFWSSNPNDRLQEQYAEIEQEEEDRRNNYYRFERVIRINMQILNDQVDRKIQLPHDYAYEDAKPGDVVAPKTLFGKPLDQRPDETPRQAFARWLVDKDNPRFAVVIANRLWKQVFGMGQIEPIDDMLDETKAENPELMAFLESEMKRLNFNMKEYLRILLNTEAYQRQACNEEVPPGVPYHYPGPMLRRMTAEQVWDSFLTLAVVDPGEYREIDSKARTQRIGLDLTKASAQEVLDADNKFNEIEYNLAGKYQQKYIYQGTLLGRASELPSPLPASHFIRMFGQSDREQISSSSTAGSVPQVLFMFNGPITHMLLEKNSTMYNNVMRKKNVVDQVKVIFETILAREPDAEELEIAKDEVKRNGPAGFGNVIWSLVNTREFLFIQ